MEKEFVSFDQAVALNELGLDEPCLAFYGGKNDKKIYFNSYRDGTGDFEPFKKHERLSWFGAPLKQQVFRWFRDEYNLDHILYKTGDPWGHIVYCLKIRNSDTGVIFTFQYLTYEEAENACIDELISIAKQQDNGKL